MRPGPNPSSGKTRYALIVTRPVKIRPSSEDAPPRIRPGFDPSSEKTRTVLIATRPPKDPTIVGGCPDCYEAAQDPTIVGGRPPQG